MMGLTDRQADLLQYIKDFISGGDGTAPSFAQMADGIGTTSKGSIHQLVTALVERGFIRRIPNRARAIEIIDQNPLESVPTELLISEMARRGIHLINLNNPTVRSGAERSEIGPEHTPYDPMG